jgi:hypothetical protein
MVYLKYFQSNSLTLTSNDSSQMPSNSSFMNLIDVIPCLLSYAWGMNDNIHFNITVGPARGQSTCGTLCHFCNSEYF